MKVVVIGAGAIGGLIAARLARSGHEVSVFARGRTLRAIRARGLQLIEGASAPITVHPSSVTDQVADLPPAELAVVAVKAPSLPGLVPRIAGMLTSVPIVVPVLNGLPWWFVDEYVTPVTGARPDVPDPSRALAVVHRDRLLGSVVFPASSCPEPGVIRHASGERIVFGEIEGGTSERVATVAGMFTAAGFDAVASPCIRDDVWLKLLGNACFNPVSLLVGASTDRLIDDARVNALFVRMMAELAGIGARLGVTRQTDPLERLVLTRRLGRVKTSMLQDAEAARAVEIDTIVGAVVAIAEALGVPAPRLSAVHALARLRAETANLLLA
ncbi:2-dehydropantoate 2-reductase [Amycolatopsis mediterranei S699]|uniref:2-dehydropantoate 2-reductase n=2 Tax=Amycolatopsis mediterranei TaxID=33910 RepID=A0A0H3DDH0_AMYMU|nr:2-dehydropantoate 2-reductase [Amycolatopsis mediterranei]ADJ48985.1 2-dehydropantoate 2-reductase [Amycolatopsis mediterranei U32]AEK45935.1 2-dehydropantoate 2-reductase [Amycolatopsis mediterranei S699]AFO80693.1 2-dehydropantoate 2-reductase [Amycolatopsis mediterranei S699]AGT87821.1 2-dehydropantoate 2-reductase [Amycolatopsis mediterranei RB]KDU93897.1 2-dehydropantoate 2-reductase [Amycolatopsis mediterranei]